MDVQQSLSQARQWLAQGLLSEAQEMLDSLRRQFEQEESPSPAGVAELWRGMLALAEARRDAAAVQDAVPRMLQAGRQVHEFDSEAMGSLLHAAAQALASVGAGADAETFFTQAYRRLPEGDAVRFEYALRLAFFYASYGHLDHAIRWAQDAVGRATPDNLERAQRSLANLLDARGKSLEAQKIRQEMVTRDPWILVEQARSQRRLGWASKAEPLYREALKQLPASASTRIARELALTLLSRRDIGGAQAVLQEALQSGDPVSFEHQLVRLELARLGQFEGRFAETETVVQEVLASWGERYGAHHPLCLKLSEVLIELSILRRDFLPARVRCQQRLKLAAEHYGSDHPSVARALYWMSQVYSHKGERENAQQALHQAQLIWDLYDEPCEVERAQVHYGMGLNMADQMEFYRAEDEVRKACDLVEQGLGDHSPTLGLFLAGLSEIHRVTGRDRQSQEVAQRSQELLRPKR